MSCYSGLLPTQGKGVRQGEGGVCPCVSTMAHAINDRTVIMSACSLMAFLVERPEEWGEDGLCGAERYTGKIECVTQTRCKKNHLGASEKMEVKKEKLFATVVIYLCVHVCAERAGLRFLGRAEGCPKWFHYTCSHARTHDNSCLLPPLFPYLLNTYQWGFALVCVGHNYNNWFFLRLQNNGGGRQLIWVEDPREGANVLTWKGKGWLTGWPHAHSAVVMQLQTIVPPLSIFLSLSLSCSHKQISVPACWHQSHRAWLVPGCSPAYWMVWHLRRQTAW